MWEVGLGVELWLENTVCTVEKPLHLWRVSCKNIYQHECVFVVGFIHYFICAYGIVSVKLCNALYDIPPNKI